MLPDLDFLIIETYEQLAYVLLGVAALAFAGRWLWRRRASSKSRGALRQMSLAGRPVPKHDAAQPPTPFDRVASYIDTANGKAQHIAKTQTAAALKLDTAEVAVNRLLADIDGIMAAPRAATHQTEALVVPAEVAPPRASMAA